MNILETWNLMFPGGLGWFLVLSILVLGVAHVQAYRTRWAAIPCILLGMVCGGIMWIGIGNAGLFGIPLIEGVPIAFGLCLAGGASAPAWILKREIRKEIIGGLKCH